MPVYIPQELVECYQCTRSKESFKQLDTTLKYPVQGPKERTASRASSSSQVRPFQKGFSGSPQA